MTTNSEKERSQNAVYLLVPAVKIVAAIVFIWIEVPSFTQLALNPGRSSTEAPEISAPEAGRSIARTTLGPPRTSD